MAAVIVAGGGIGGMATALALADRGHRPVVLERREVFAEIGAGIQIGPNGFQALDRLGVGAQVRARAVHIDELQLMDGTTGARVAGMPLTGRYRARFGNPYAVVHRADLYAPLLEACRSRPQVELRPGSPVLAYEQDTSGVTVQLVGGEPVRGDALIGADGIRSTVRAQLLGDGEPRVSGHAIYRSVIPMERVPEELHWNTVTLWAGPKWHFVHYPIGGGRFLNLAATRDAGATEAVVGRPVGREQVLERFPGLGATASALLRLGTDWREWVLCDRDPVRRWTDGRVLLLGDAAHPMLQYAAQGACMALEDAVLLGDLVDRAEGDRLPELFRRFNDERHERTGRAQLAAREIGRRLYHPAGAEAAERNRMLSGLSEDELYARVAWLHGARIPEPAGVAATQAV
jgi:3-hydroxybenzoate 6-monooxygenase